MKIRRTTNSVYVISGPEQMIPKNDEKVFENGANKDELVMFLMREWGKTTIGSSFVEKHWWYPLVAIANAIRQMKDIKSLLPHHRNIREIMKRLTP